MRLPIFLLLLVAVATCSEELSVSSDNLPSNARFFDTDAETTARNHINTFLNAIKEKNEDLLFKLVDHTDEDRKNAAELLISWANVKLTVQSAEAKSSDEIDVQTVFVIENKRFTGIIVLRKNEESPTNWIISEFPDDLTPAKRRRMLPANKMIKD